MVADSSLPFTGWKNPYIEKVATLPEIILSASSRDITQEERELLLDKAKSFDGLYLELGSGSGNHLVELASRNPGRLYLGFELRFKRVYRTAEKASQKGLNNLMVAKTSAMKVPTIFPHNSLDGIYINFPDPWNKRRWEKHRMLSPEFIKAVYNNLKPGAFIAYKTDHQERFADAVAAFEASGLYEINKCTNDLHASPWATDNIVTEFEGMFMSEGVNINLLEAKKKRG